MIDGFAPGWRQVAVCFMLLAATSMIASTYSIVAIPLATTFQPSRMVLMLAMTVLSGVSALLSPLFGSMMDRVPLRRVVLAGGFLLGSGYIAISFAGTFPQVLAVYGLLIAPANVLLGPLLMTVHLSRWFAQRRGRAIGLAITGISAGGFIFPFILQGLLEANADWRWALRYLGLILMVWTMPTALLLIDRPADRGLHADGGSEEPDDVGTRSAGPPVSARALLGDPAFWLIVVTVAIVTAGLKGMVTNLAPLATDAGVQARWAALLIPIYAASGFVAKLNFAALADRLGPRVLMFASLSGFAAGMACLTQAGSGYPAMVLGVVLAGLFGGLMIPIESYLAPRVFGQRAVGRAMGLLSGAILVAMLLTPPLFGLIYDLTGSYTAIFWTFAALALLALLWTPSIRVTPRLIQA